MEYKIRYTSLKGVDTIYIYEETLEVEFPDFLTNFYKKEDYMILDIETTGLSPTHAHIILVGIIHYDEKWRLTQIFCDHVDEELDLLDKLLSYISKEHLLITYNGHAFDIPFINKRLKHHGFKRQLNMVKHFDLYRVVRSSKKALNLSNYKLKTIEEFLGINRSDQISGKESVDLYFQYMSQPTTKLRDIILLHNADDIRYMIPTLGILDYVPVEIIEKYYPYHYENFILIDMIQSQDQVKLEIQSSSLLPNLVDFNDAYKLKLDTYRVECTLPYFSINEYNFIDSDILPFFEIKFNDMTVEDQKKLLINSKYDLFTKCSKWLVDYYKLEL